MYTDTEIEELRERAEAWDLSGRELLNDTEAVKRDCNGIGAEWMGKYLRGALDKTNPTLRPTAAIHDRRYAEGNSRRQYPSEESARMAADMEFLENGLKSADARYGWYDLRRYRVREQARKFYAALRAVRQLTIEKDAKAVEVPAVYFAEHWTEQLNRKDAEKICKKMQERAEVDRG